MNQIERNVEHYERRIRQLNFATGAVGSAILAGLGYGYKRKHEPKLPTMSKNVKNSLKRELAKQNMGYNKRPKLSSSSRNNAGGIVTDNVMGAATKWRQKRYNRRAVKKWKRFQGKVLKAVEKEQATHTRLWHQSGSLSIVSGAQTYIPFTLNGYNGDISSGGDINDQQDLSILALRELDPAAGTAVSLGSKIKLIGSHMDIEITNSPTDAVPSCPVVLDIYKVVCRKDELNGTSPGMNTMGKAYINGFAQQVVGDTIGTDVLPSSIIPGVTPFDSPGFCQRWKIVNKKRIMLDVGKSISFGMGHSKTKILNTDLTQNTAVRRGHTKGYLVIASSSVQLTTAGVVSNPAFNLSFESLRSYKWKLVVDQQVISTSTIA